MFPLTLSTVYKQPADYKPPEAQFLSNNTEYPNLNSTDYFTRPLNRQMRQHQCWECVISNENYSNVVIATNKLSGREWTSTIWGYEEIDDCSEAKAVFNVQSDALTACMVYATENTFIVALQTGKLQIWSTFVPVEDKKTYCLFQLSSTTEHTHPITSLELMKSNSSRCITGDRNGTLKIWATDQADLLSTSTYNFAHCDAITSVSSSSDRESLFVTSSMDRSILLWDVRDTRPAKALFAEHTSGFKCLTRPTANTHENMLIAGDQCGYIHTLDKRTPNKFVNSIQIMNKPIHKLIPNRSQLAILADTNVLKLITLNDLNVIFENNTSESFLRDALWYKDNQLVVVGFDGKLHKHKIN